MATKLTIWVDSLDNDNDPIASAVSNLEYDGFDILKWDIAFDVELENNND
jgi:hypothetical protein